MECEQKESKNVKPADVIILKSVYHHRINVVVPERIRLEQSETRIGDTHCKMRNVVDDERKHDQPAHHHVARSKRCFDILPLYVLLRSCTAVFDRQLNRHVNMNDDNHEQEQTNYPKQRPEVAQVLRVT